MQAQREVDEALVRVSNVEWPKAVEVKNFESGELNWEILPKLINDSGLIRMIWQETWIILHYVLVFWKAVWLLERDSDSLCSETHPEWCSAAIASFPATLVLQQVENLNPSQRRECSCTTCGGFPKLIIIGTIHRFGARWYCLRHTTIPMSIPGHPRFREHTKCEEW